MTEDSKITKDLDRLARQIRATEKNLAEFLKKTENLGATIRSEMRSRQSAKNKRKNK